MYACEPVCTCLHVCVHSCGCTRSKRLTSGIFICPFFSTIVFEIRSLIEPDIHQVSQSASKVLEIPSAY